MAIELLDTKTGFWLKDFCRKILPAQFREGQKEYFGKKDMKLHVDVFFHKVNGRLRKKVYFTAVYRCKQGLVVSLCLADVVLEKLKKDFPHLMQLYAKSDNAPSYHDNFHMEALYKLCKGKQISLQRHDYKQPSRGKDQCDRESAGAKCVLRNFVDASNNLITTEDIYNGLHHGKGIQNADVAVVKIDSKASRLSGSTLIPNISYYHSFRFFSDHMVMWRYFRIGNGKKWKYTDVIFHPSVEIVKPYHSTSKIDTASSLSLFKKPHVDRKVNSLTFCPILPRSLMDRARSSYVDKMRTPNLNASNDQELLTSVRSTEGTNGQYFTSICGWALPRRKTFRYSVQNRRHC